jgi:hypothetical protein
MIRALFLSLVLSLGSVSAWAADDVPPTAYGYQTNTGSASVDTLPPVRRCHVTNIRGAADDGTPSCYAHVTNQTGTTDDAPPTTYVHITNPNGTPDGTVPTTYIHVTNFNNPVATGSGLIPDANSANCLLATTTDCLSVNQ